MAKIVVGLSASIAAYKACDIIRTLVHAGHEVHAVLTPNARHFVQLLTLEMLSQNRAHVQEFPSDGELRSSAGGNILESMPHIFLKDRLDLFVTAPATANTIGKFANGLADNLLTSLYLALERSRTKILVCPAMNPHMYSHPAVVRNIEQLKKDGAQILEADEAMVLCKDTGRGKLPAVEAIVARIEAMLQSV